MNAPPVTYKSMQNLGHLAQAIFSECFRQGCTEYSIHVLFGPNSRPNSVLSTSDCRTIYLFIYLYQATRPINIINSNKKRPTETQICR